MECKYYFENGQWDDGDELIDTLWNVNLCMMPYSCHAEFRINRYIMECKSLQTDDVVITGIRINRYIMECKSGRTYPLPHICNELIDTLWNVNMDIDETNLVVEMN